MIKLISFISILLLSSFTDPVDGDANKDVILWSEKKLTFDDFKGKPKKQDNATGEFSIKISWTKNEVVGKVPVYTIYNKMLRKDSWMSIKHDGLLKEYQFFWDMQELYVRKIRKDIDILNKNNSKDKDKYYNTISNYANAFGKERKKYKGILMNQPDLYKIVNQQYQDSLKLYDAYKVK